MLRVVITFMAFIALAGCTPKIPKEALELRPESLALRQLQTRKFETQDEKILLQSAASVLQDMGYNIDETETSLGVIVGSKNRDATDAGQVVGAVVLAVLFNSHMAVDKEQKIRASIVTNPAGKSTNLRVTFQRVVWNTRNEISKTESLEDPILYQDFFEKLSKSVFLEANAI